MVLARWRNGRLASWKVSNTLTRDVKVVILRRVRLPVRQVTVVLCKDAQNWRVHVHKLEAPRRYGNFWLIGKSVEINCQKTGFARDRLEF